MKFHWLRFFHPHAICALATLGPVGYWGKAPGTLGSLAGLLFYTGVVYPLSPTAMVLVLAALAYFAAGICEGAQTIMHAKDPGYIIFDEFVAIPWVFVGVKEHLGNVPLWPYLILGFALFRLFDILKPLGIKKLQNLPGGMGVVADDIAAALASALCLQGFLGALKYFY